MQLLTESLKTTLAIGRELGSVCEPGDIICLSGELGAGKTTLVQAVAKGAGVDQKEYVNSPTFAILHEYRGTIPIYHMDFYRLDSSEDVIELGLEEYLYDQGLVLIEWFERASDIIPESALLVNLSVTNEFSRKMTLKSSDHRWAEKLTRLNTALTS